MHPLTYKVTLDNNNVINGIELHQNGQYVTVSIKSYGIGTQKTGHKWDDVKESIDTIIKKQTAVTTTSSKPSYTT